MQIKSTVPRVIIIVIRETYVNQCYNRDNKKSGCWVGGMSFVNFLRYVISTFCLSLWARLEYSFLYRQIELNMFPRSIKNFEPDNVSP